MAHLSGYGLGQTPAEARRDGERVYTERWREDAYQREAAEAAYRVRHGLPHPNQAAEDARLAAKLGLTVEQVAALDEDELIWRIEAADEAAYRAEAEAE